MNDRPGDSCSFRAGRVRVGGGLQLEGLRGEVKEVVEVDRVDRGHQLLRRRFCV